MKPIEELKTYYEALDNRFEGYIQMSDREAKTFTSKPSWKDLHETNNFIFEAALFDGDRSIMIRQHNEKFIVIDKKISEFKETNHELFFTKDKKVKMVQVWEAKEDINCENFPVLKPTLQLFAGFEGGLS